mmetsp:Transcript_53833/g.99513  ORF Transcript_53833/g.99513 Transcript_53833/m.99513 type:complete len:324 (+) Transcript_53833:72-1043(+)
MESQSNETVTFDVGGDKYKVLEQTIRAKPDTLLCTLLDDIGRKDKAQAIFVDGNPKRFPYILDWYRFGSICIPRSIGMDEMRRECAYFQLPDDLKISRERASLEEAVECLQEVRKKARSDAHDAKLAAQEPQVAALVAAVFSEIVGSQELTCSGLGDVQLTNAVLRQLGTIAFPLETTNVLESLVAKAAEFGWSFSKQERTHLKKFVKKLVDIDKQNLDSPTPRGSVASAVDVGPLRAPSALRLMQQRLALVAPRTPPLRSVLPPAVAPRATTPATGGVPRVRTVPGRPHPTAVPLRSVSRTTAPTSARASASASSTVAAPSG